MKGRFAAVALATAGVLAASMAYAECTGGHGRGWGDGKGDGKFEMTTADKVCVTGYVNFINDAANTQIPADDIVVTRAPKKGTLAMTNRGLQYTPNPGFTGKDKGGTMRAILSRYTPNPGFTGKDKYCFRATSSDVKNAKLSGCDTITVRP